MMMIFCDVGTQLYVMNPYIRLLKNPAPKSWACPWWHGAPPPRGAAGRGKSARIGSTKARQSSYMHGQMNDAAERCCVEQRRRRAELDAGEPVGVEKKRGKLHNGSRGG